jgi:phosphatidylglycerophosphate synthase
MLTLPNILTLSRIFAVPLLVFLLWKPSWFDYAITFGLYCLVGITDYFDGYLARAQGTVSRLGVFLDPIADKIMVVGVIVMLVSTRQPQAEPVIHGLHIVPALIILLARSPSRGFASSSPESRCPSRSAASPSGRRPSSSCRWARSFSAPRRRNGRGSTGWDWEASGRRRL